LGGCRTTISGEACSQTITPARITADLIRNNGAKKRTAQSMADDRIASGWQQVRMSFRQESGICSEPTHPAPRWVSIEKISSFGIASVKRAGRSTDVCAARAGKSVGERPSISGFSARAHRSIFKPPFHGGGRGAVRVCVAASSAVRSGLVVPRMARA